MSICYTTYRKHVKWVSSKKQPALETFSSLENIKPTYKLKFVISVCHWHTKLYYIT